MHALFKAEVECKNAACPSGLFSLRVPQFESDQPGTLNSAGVMLFGFPRRQRLPKSLWELHNSRVAAQTRKVSDAPFQPIPRKLWRQFKWILFLTDSAVRVRSHQPGSAVSTAWDLRFGNANRCVITNSPPTGWICLIVRSCTKR
jgi:hypothetical protein